MEEVPGPQLGVPLNQTPSMKNVLGLKGPDLGESPLGQGQGATNGVAWGDYSGSTIDGDNLTDLWTIQSITDTTGKGDTIIVKVPFKGQGK